MTLLYEEIDAGQQILLLVPPFAAQLLAEWSQSWY